jgi:hypothetical protein
VQSGGARPDRNALAVEQADADEIAHGALYGIAPVDLTRQDGDGEGLRMGAENQAENGSLSRHP